MTLKEKLVAYILKMVKRGRVAVCGGGNECREGEKGGGLNLKS